jgi:hypothetical protein
MVAFAKHDYRVSAWTAIFEAGRTDDEIVQQGATHAARDHACGDHTTGERP